MFLLNFFIHSLPIFFVLVSFSAKFLFTRMFYKHLIPEPFGPKIDSSRQSIAVLKVDVPAKIRIGAQLTVLAGVTLSILCNAFGLPKPNITWTLDGRPLVTQNHVTIKGNLLEIVNSGSEDSGSYVCTATSALGEDTATTSLTVQSK